MATRTANDPRTVLEIVGLAADLTPVDAIATRLQIPPANVQQIVDAYGYPDEEKLAKALTVLTRRAGMTRGVEVTDPEPAPRRDQATPSAPLQARTGSSAQQLDFVDVPLNDLHPDPDNPRSDVGDVAELAASIAEVGLLQPIVARRVGDRLVIVAGHRRHAAVRRIGWPTVPVVIRDEMRSDEVIAAMLIENSHRQDLDPVDEARGLAHLRQQMGGSGISQAMLAKRVGRSPMWVSARMSLLSLTPDEQDKVRAGELRLQDAERMGREASGRARPAGSTGYPHLGQVHPLRPLAVARCKRMGHKARGRNSVTGSGACGECWESIIRANERESLHGDSADKGRCVLCDTPVSGGERS